MKVFCCDRGFECGGNEWLWWVMYTIKYRLNFDLGNDLTCLFIQQGSKLDFELYRYVFMAGFGDQIYLLQASFVPVGPPSQTVKEFLASSEMEYSDEEETTLAKAEDEGDATPVRDELE